MTNALNKLDSLVSLLGGDYEFVNNTDVVYYLDSKRFDGNGNTREDAVNDLIHSIGLTLAKFGQVI